MINIKTKWATRQNVHIKISWPTLTCVRMCASIRWFAFVVLSHSSWQYIRIILVGGEMNMCLFAATMRIVVIYWIVFKHNLNTQIYKTVWHVCVCMRTVFYVGCISDLWRNSLSLGQRMAKKPVNQQPTNNNNIMKWTGHKIKKLTHTHARMHTQTYSNF